MDDEKYIYIGKIIESLHPSVTIADGNGKFVYIGKYGEEFFGIKRQDIVGKNIHDEFIKQYFRPCITEMVFNTREKVATMQKNAEGTEVLVTGVPFFDKKGTLEMIIVFSSWEVGNYEELQNSYKKLQDEVEKLTHEIHRLSKEDHVTENILEESRMYKNLVRVLEVFAKNNLSAYVYGPSGCGRKYLSKMAYVGHKIIVDYDCELLEEKMLDEELFGKYGLLEDSEESIVFIEHIEKLSPTLQRKLIFELENNGRCAVAISEYSLERLKAEGKITSLFYDYFHSYQVQVDPLSDRPEDLKGFIDYYLDYYNKKYNRKITFTPKAMNALLSYSWIENIPEVRGVIERIVLTTERDKVDFYNLPENISRQSMDAFLNGETLGDMMEFYEKTIISRAYDKYKTTTEVAKRLGISQPSAARKIKKYVKMKE